MNHPDLVPKHERSPTPPLMPISSGAKLVAPMPLASRKTSPDYAAARKKWLKEEIGKLTAMGLKIKNFFIREDGLVIDWESPVPVWPDTLKPASLPEPHNSIPIPVDDDTRMQNLAKTQLDVQTEELDRQARELEDMAVDFLKRYAETFDMDRAALASAYADDASFSYCVHDIVSLNSFAAAFTNPSEAQRFAPRKGSRNLLNQQSGNLNRGRVEIIPALLSLGPHRFCSRSPTDVRWNVLALELGGTPCVFLTSYGHLTEERAGREHSLSFDQSFILQRPEDSGMHQLSSGLWPMVAICHQLSIRDMSLIPSTR